MRVEYGKLYDTSWLYSSKKLLNFVITSNKAEIEETLFKMNGIIVNNSYINNNPMANAKGKFFVYWDPVSNISVNLILIIIITNKNKIAIAPTYTIIYEIPINPIPNKIKYPAALTKTEIKKITAITGFLEVITKTLENRAAKANKSIKKFFIINENKKKIYDLNIIFILIISFF